MPILKGCTKLEIEDIKKQVRGTVIIDWPGCFQWPLIILIRPISKKILIRRSGSRIWCMLGGSFVESKLATKLKS
jgi:hypothetical protein